MVKNPKNATTTPASKKIIPNFPQKVLDDTCWYPANKQGAPFISDKNPYRCSYKEPGLTFDMAMFMAELYHMGTGEPVRLCYAPKLWHGIGMIDVDTAKISDADDREMIEAAHAQIKDVFGDTYIEHSKTNGSVHILIKLDKDHPFVGHRYNNPLRLELFVSEGYVVLTFDCTTGPELATIKNHDKLLELFPATGVTSLRLSTGMAMSAVR